jgi:hypothetical protein
VEADEASNPVHVGLLGAQAVVLEADAGAHEIEQARRRMGGTIRGHTGDSARLSARGESIVRPNDGLLCVIAKPVVKASIRTQTRIILCRFSTIKRLGHTE